MMKPASMPALPRPAQAQPRMKMVEAGSGAE